MNQHLMIRTLGSTRGWRGAPNSVAVRFPSRCARLRPLSPAFASQQSGPRGLAFA
jgi:hypothetical protein